MCSCVKSRERKRERRERERERERESVCVFDCAHMFMREPIFIRAWTYVTVALARAFERARVICQSSSTEPNACGSLHISGRTNLCAAHRA